MLKALELVGFKSFADKTRLEFPRGITVVVGPNGSGKSNVVDAIKWVLGEQSVKSLRGKEMADVIFNGSASRRPMNSAEVTVTFDNADRLLGVDAPEVHITRRVYRSGEGEYFINKQPCRLKDIRELFAGTGIATEAYSVIEQGKVDVLLQSSPRDRRMIFEEAAGISRFKTKKVEAQRRLERVDQNLLRLSDIVEEVDNRLKGVRAQATKARRYKEYADRLQELRTQVGLTDWRQLTSKLESLEAELQTTRDEAGEVTASAEALEAQGLNLEVEISQVEQTLHASEERIARNRARIATLESTIDHERRRSRDLDEEVARHRRQLSAMNLRAGDLQHQLQTAGAAIAAVEARQKELAGRLGEEERALTKVTTQLDELRVENEQRRSAHLEALRAAAALGNQISGLDSRVTSAHATSERGQKRLDDLTSARDQVATEMESLQSRLAELAQASAARHAERREAEGALAQLRNQAARAQQELAELRERQSGATERAAVLEELEKRLEGLSAGVKDLLVKLRDDATAPAGAIRGLVADLFHVNVETAPLIEIALGEAAQYLVVETCAELVPWLQQDASRLIGRVGLLRLDIPSPPTGADAIDLKGQPGVLGRADSFVETNSECAPLAKRLLGRTWLVERLCHALTLQTTSSGRFNFVTMAGELVTSGGVIALGPRQSSTGLISRRSELRALREQLVALGEKLAQAMERRASIEDQVRRQDQLVSDAISAHQVAQERLGEQRLAASAATERHAQFVKQLAVVDAELRAASVEHEQAVRQLAEAREKRATTESLVSELEGRLKDGAAQAMQLDQIRQRHSRETSGTIVELARCEQQCEHLRSQRSQLERDQHERSRALADHRQQMQQCTERAREAEFSILRAESETATLYLRKESFAAETVAQLNTREAYRQQRAEFTQEVSRLRGRLKKLESKLHAKELSANEVRHERTTLADRLREDYNIELAELEHVETPAEISQREEVEREIADLRGKLNSIGGVNLDALAELEELEARFASLSGQYNDLSSAKASLEQIISRINADSRRLFAETLEVVRGHFQALFRKLFGGGQADIVLDEGVDILDSGIEIVARPPGKEPRSISLLSGGEKTLTCVALLLSIFRSRPSPFCVLDEVDAALDEANIERFVGVLKEFLVMTQFVVVTHSKKTMTCASTLYGVTMQESGISKRVSVRFEDVSDNGEINSFQPEPDEAKSGDETQAA